LSKLTGAESTYQARRVSGSYTYPQVCCSGGAKNDGFAPCAEKKIEKGGHP
jgi:hypothetical protein